MSKCISPTFQGWKVFTSYFSSPSSLILSTLHLLERRLWPPAAVPLPSSNLLALPSTPPQSQGFTALILTYNRLESLFQVKSALFKIRLSNLQTDKLESLEVKLVQNYGLIKDLLTRVKCGATSILRDPFKTFSSQPGYPNSWRG